MGMLSSEGRVVFNDLGKAVGLRNNDGSVSFFADLSVEQIEQLLLLLENEGSFVVASQAEAEAGEENTKGMTPLRVKQAIDAQVVALVAAATGSRGGDSVTATTRHGDGRLATITVDGLTWTYVYSGLMPTGRTALGILSVDISVNGAGDFVEDPEDNVFVDGMQIQCTTAQAWAVEAALIALIGTPSAVRAGLSFSVTDCSAVYPDGGSGWVYRPAKWTWSGLRMDYDFEIADERVVTHGVAGATSATLSTIVVPKEFGQRKHQSLQVCPFATGGVAGTAVGNNSGRTKLNGVTGPGTGPFSSQNIAVSTTDTLLWDSKKTLKILSNSSQIAMPSATQDNSPGAAVTPIVLAINSLTTDFTFEHYNVQGANASLYTLHRFGVRCHTRF